MANTIYKKEKENFNMIIYFSGTGYQPEKVLNKTNIMMTFYYSSKKVQKRFIKIYNTRKKTK